MTKAHGLSLCVTLVVGLLLCMTTLNAHAGLLSALAKLSAGAAEAGAATRGATHVAGTAARAGAGEGRLAQHAAAHTIDVANVAASINNQQTQSNMSANQAKPAAKAPVPLTAKSKSVKVPAHPINHPVTPRRRSKLATAH